MNRKRCPCCGRVHLDGEAVRKDKRTGELHIHLLANTLAVDDISVGVSTAKAITACKDCH